MQRMHTPVAGPFGQRSSLTAAACGLLVVILALGGHQRFMGLGDRSLWLDEFCTWHVSRLPLAESLRWGPELTIPPLYQLTVRAAADGPRPPEWRLRLPAAVCGLLVVLAGWWLGNAWCHGHVGCALAALLACDVLQIEYSREARPYSMLVLGCTLSTGLWYRLAMRPRRGTAAAYIVVTALAVHAHFLAALTVLGHAMWWYIVRGRRRRSGPAALPLAAVGATVLLCTPVLLRSLWHREALAQDIAWIEPAHWRGVADVLIDVSFGPIWVATALVPAVAIWALAAGGWVKPRGIGAIASGREDVCGLLLCWLLFAWLGLAVVSWLVQPVMVTRYALPAAVPALLFPLIVAHRLRRWVPLVVAPLFCAGALWWGSDVRAAAPGFRELVQYVQRDGDPDSTNVVLVIGHSANPHWGEMERLALRYYPIENRPVVEVELNENERPKDDSIFRDPRPLYLIVFRSDPFALLRDVGREAESIMYEGETCPQLFFEPYRLVRVAALNRP